MNFSTITRQSLQLRIPATYMRGGTSKGIFFKLSDLPRRARVPGATRDALLSRVMGSPDPYGRQMDGMGGATSSTSKAAILSDSNRPDHDVDYLFGQVSLDDAFVDWTGNCGNLTAAVGSYAIANDLVDAARIPHDGVAAVRIWQANIGKSIIARVPIVGGKVQEIGTFKMDGVAFPSAEIQIIFIDPANKAKGDIFPTGNIVDEFDVPGVGTLSATFIDSGIPTVFLNAKDVGYEGTELQADINGDPKALVTLETIRAHGAVHMGLADAAEGVARHTPKIALVAPPKDYVSSSGDEIAAMDMDLNVRALSMGLLHHAMMGTAAVAVASAAAIPGTLVNGACGGGERNSVKFGHPSGTMSLGAEAEQEGGVWSVDRVTMSRSARVLMEGWVRVPEDSF